MYPQLARERNINVINSASDLRRAVADRRIDLVVIPKSFPGALSLELDVDVVVLEEPRSVFEIVGDVWALGTVLGRAGEAAELCRTMMEVLASYQGSLPPLRTYIEAVTREGIVGLGPLTPAGSAIEFLGLKNVGALIGLERFEPDIRALRTLNPDIVLIDLDPETGIDLNNLGQWFMDRGMSDLEAVKRGRIVVFVRELTNFGYSFVVKTVPKIVHRVLELM